MRCRRRGSPHCAAALLLWLAASAVGPVWPAIPTPAVPKPAAPDTGANSAIDSEIASVQSRLKALRPRLRDLGTDGVTTPLPPGVQQEEWVEHQQLLRAAEIYLQNHLETLAKLSTVRRTARDARTEGDAWHGFARPPPNPLDFVDSLWERLRTRKREIEAIRAEQELVGNLIDEARSAVETARRALRGATERLEQASRPADVDRSRWLSDLADVRVLRAEAWLGTLESERTLKVETLAWRTAERDLLQRMATAATRAFPFGAEERDARLAALATKAQQVDQQLARETQAQNVARARMDTARNAWQSALEAAQQDANAVALLRETFETRKAVADTAAAGVNMLQVFRQTVPLQQEMWRKRFELQQGNDRLRVRDAIAEIARYVERVSRWRAYIESELSAVRATVDALEARARPTLEASGEKSLADERMRAFVQREAVLRHAATDIESIQAMLDTWRETLALRTADVTPADRVRGVAGSIADVGRRIWDFEVLTVEDKIVVEGREIVGKRSLTIGKVTKVALILVLGFWVTTKLAARGRRLALRRLGGRQSAALLVQRAISLSLGASLLVFALVSANIPLAAFAFLGGALAIGIGFGAQNLLNNFISGLILLIEKPIKLGDLVDVNGVVGRVTDIGSRCSKVRRADGIDLLIPNSTFLQQTVTNWTHSDQHSRFSVKVGVGYGSPTREASDLILRAVQEQPEVLKHPSPDVFFEDFGDSALIFTADYWLDLTLDTKSRGVASEIRHRIDRLLREHGIEIPFPQRDVRLDSAVPLQVEVALKTGSGPVQAAARTPSPAAPGP